MARRAYLLLEYDAGAAQALGVVCELAGPITGGAAKEPAGSCFHEQALRQRGLLGALFVCLFGARASESFARLRRLKSITGAYV